MYFTGHLGKARSGNNETVQTAAVTIAADRSASCCRRIFSSQWQPIRIGPTMRRCIDDVDDGPNAASSESKEFRDPHAGIFQVKAVDTQRAQEDRKKKSCHPLFFGEYAWNLANGVRVSGCDFDNRIR
jgi:hypothetical protein